MQTPFRNTFVDEQKLREFTSQISQEMIKFFRGRKVIQGGNLDYHKEMENSEIDKYVCKYKKWFFH